MSYKRSRQTYEADIQKHESPFVTYGTPLPPVDEHTRDDGSYVPVWKQEVTDDRGRKRLHGAFTGGFSAGYYNTVGSKEGWTPSTFVSSRTNRAKDIKNAPTQKAEDFMDEEDVREAEESRSLATTDGFAGFGTQDDAMHRNAMMDLLRPVDDSMGMKLLNRMGWKQGQGIGPRVKRRTDPDDDSSETYLFAPEDVPMTTFVKKTDFKGLGYDEDNTQTLKPPQLSGAGPNQQKIISDDEDNDRKGFSLTSRTKKDRTSVRGGFGVGILNDTGSDEDDPYSMGPRISYNKTLGGDKKLNKKQLASVGAANPLLKKKPVFISKKLTSMQNALRKCHDGRLPLQGFVLADELDNFSAMSLSDEKYRPPEVPPGWKPAKASEAGDSTSTLEQSGIPRQSVREAAKSSTHTTTSRAQVLGEAPLPGKSVFDYLTPAARDRLAKATGKTNLPQALGETISGVNLDSPAKSLADLVPVLDTETAQQALARSATGGFMPYAEDLAKRQRYKIFLEYSAGLSSSNELPSRPPGKNTTDEDHINELTEFVRAAEVFRPVSGGLGSRFTSSSVQNNNQSQEGIAGRSTGAESLISKPVKKPEDTAEVAAKVGMFGPLTRTVLSFQPTRLVCKRFGVEYVGATGMPSSASTFSNPVTDTAPPPTEMPASRFQPAGYTTQEHTHTGPNQSSNELTDRDPTIVPSAPDQDPFVPSTRVDPDQNEALEQERPGQAVFRAIFGSDSEDDD